MKTKTMLKRLSGEKNCKIVFEAFIQLFITMAEITCINAIQIVKWTITEYLQNIFQHRNYFYCLISVSVSGGLEIRTFKERRRRRRQRGLGAAFRIVSVSSENS